MGLRKRIALLGNGDERQRYAAELAKGAYVFAREHGPHQMAADFGAPLGADPAVIAHAYAVATAPAAYVAIVSEAAEDGLRVYLDAEEDVEVVVFEAIRSNCAEFGPWQLGYAGYSIREIAEEIADEATDRMDIERSFAIEAALQGFRENLERFRR